MKKNGLIFLVDFFRLKQWVKNLFIFFPLLFSGQFFDNHLLFNCFKAFWGFCFISSGVYILNDYLDREQDRFHPQKAQRPMAQLKIDSKIIALLIIFMTAVGLIICQTIGTPVTVMALIYIFVHLIYNFYTKRIVILDVIFVASGFHIRIWAGALASQIVPSVWLQMCVFLLALFLGFTKRRYELSTLKDKASEHRSVLAHYTSYLLDQIIIICSTLAIAFYGLIPFLSILSIGWEIKTWFTLWLLSFMEFSVICI